VVADGGIGVGLVGYGLAGRSFHAPFIEAVDGLRLAAIATGDPERQARAAAEHPGAVVVGTVDDVLASDDVEIVVVAAPNRFHVPLGIRALQAGRHVLVDKPIAMDVPEAETLIEAAERAGRILSVYQNRRWDGDFLTARSLIDDGTLGAIDSLEARFERWAVVGDEWREQAEEAGGPHRDLGAHLVDQSLILFGAARRVVAQMDRRRPGSRVMDSVFVAIDHADGVHSRLWTSLIGSRTGPRLRVRGLAGEYIKEDLDPQESQLLDGMRPTELGFGEEAPERWGRLTAIDGSIRSVPTERGDYRRFYEGFRDAVLGIGERPVEPADSLAVLRVLEAAERSAATGAVVTMSEGR
jgi:predicted dehydrogenase